MNSSVLLKYARVILRITKMSFKKRLLYKGDFIFSIIPTVVYAVVQILFLYFALAAGNTSTMGGFSRDELYAVFFFSQLVIGFFFMFTFTNLRLLFDQMHTGDLDYFLIKPVNPSFALQFQEVVLDAGTITIFLYSTAGIILLFQISNITTSFSDSILILWIVVLSFLLYHAMHLFAVAVGLYVERLNFQWVINNLTPLNRFPREIYPYGLQLIFTFVVPILLVVNPIFPVLQQKTDPWLIGCTFLLVAVFFAASQIFFLKGLKRYSSAA